MTVNFYSDTVEILNVDKEIFIVKGEKFTILVLDGPDKMKWFSDADPVLAIVTNTRQADFSADNLGVSEVQIQGENHELLKTLIITVVDKINIPASELNITAGEAIPK